MDRVPKNACRKVARSSNPAAHLAPVYRRASDPARPSGKDCSGRMPGS
jgi:hypothetical protein